MKILNKLPRVKKKVWVVFFPFKLIKMKKLTKELVGQTDSQDVKGMVRGGWPITEKPNKLFVSMFS